MKGKLAGSLKPPSTKKTFENARKYAVSETKTSVLEKAMAKEQSQKEGYSKYFNMLARGRRVEKSIIRCVHTNWMAPKKCC